MAPSPVSSPHAGAASGRRGHLPDPALDRSLDRPPPAARLQLEPPVQLLRHPEAEPDPLLCSHRRSVVLGGEHRAEGLSLLRLLAIGLFGRPRLPYEHVAPSSSASPSISVVPISAPRWFVPRDRADHRLLLANRENGAAPGTSGG